MQKSVKLEHTSWWGTSYKGLAIDAVAAAYSAVAVVVLATSMQSPAGNNKNPLAFRRQNMSQSHWVGVSRRGSRPSSLGISEFEACAAVHMNDLLIFYVVRVWCAVNS